MVDRDVRPFVEECDRMQGLQVFATLDDAWGGFAGRYLSALRDEYPKTCIWLWGLTSPMNQIPREKRQLRIANTAQSVADASSLASIVVPVSLPERLPSRISLDPRSPWHSSAVLGTAFETALLQTRLAARPGLQPLSMWDVADGLNTSGTQTLARLRMGVGDGARISDEEDGLYDQVDLFGLGQMKGSLPRSGKKSRVFGQLSCYRGSSLDEEDEPSEQVDHRARRLVGGPVVQRQAILSPIPSFGLLVYTDVQLTRACSQCSYDSSLKFPLLDSFPSIYENQDEESGLTVKTTLSTETSQGRHLKALQAQSTWSIALEEREALSNTLAEIADAYRDDWESDSDEDDDNA